MKITSITQQAKRRDRYSVFVDAKYAFSLSESALLESKLVSGQELTKEQIHDFKKMAADDMLYRQTLRYAAIRPRTGWEIEFYLQRKQASPILVKYILNKLRNVSLIDDEKFAQMYVNDRRLLRPTSRRKMMIELRNKRVPDDIIQKTLGDEGEERTAIEEVIRRKRRQSKYQDDLKLMQYLARQGFSYDDIIHGLQTFDGQN